VVNVQSVWENALGTEQRTDDSWDRDEPDFRNGAGGFLHTRHDSKTPLFLEEPKRTEITASVPTDKSQTNDELDISVEDFNDDISYG
jgi:hypothetical protein